MVVDREGLRSFLLNNEVSQDKVDGAMALAEPLFLVAEGKRELFAPEDQTTEADVLTALQGVLGQEKVQKVILVSESNSLRKPDAMDEVYKMFIEKALLGKLRDTRRLILFAYLVSMLGCNLYKKFGDSLFFYFVLLIAGEGNEEQREKVAALVQVTAKGWITIGTKKYEPDCWLVLVA